VNRALGTATLTLACTILLGAGAGAASAKTVGEKASGSTVSIAKGGKLVIKLGSPNSGSTGYHWDVTKKPASSVLRLKSNRTSGDFQRFTYRGRGVGKTSLTIKYVPPGQGRTAVKTFKLTVKVRAPKVA
jgi:predicted secreted protein